MIGDPRKEGSVYSIDSIRSVQNGPIVYAAVLKKRESVDDVDIPYGLMRGWNSNSRQQKRNNGNQVQLGQIGGYREEVKAEMYRKWDSC